MEHDERFGPLNTPPVCVLAMRAAAKHIRIGLAAKAAFDNGSTYEADEWRNSISQLSSAGRAWYEFEVQRLDLKAWLPDDGLDSNN